MSNTSDLSDLIKRAERLQVAVDTGFTHNFLFLIFIMKIAYNLYEMAGSRHKNHIYTLIKNTIAVSVAILSWWLIGYGFYWGKSSNGGIGYSLFAESDYTSNHHYDKFSISCGYLIISLLITLSVTLERLDLHTTIIWTFFYSTVIFPIAANWGNHPDGWLKQLGYIDLTGVGFVHTAAASSGLAAILIIGPRLNRYSEEKKKDFKLSNLQFLGIASMIFWFARYGYNNASLMHSVSDSIFNYSLMIGKTTMNVSISPAIAALTSFCIIYIFKRNTGEEFSLITVCNGLLSGLIAVSGSPGTISSWAALIIGFLSGFIYCFYSWATKRINIDDPIEALAVNLGAGTWGIVAVGWFDYNTGIVYGNEAKQFGVQLLGMVIYLCWPFACTGCLMLLLKLCNLHRLRDDIETQGLDIFKCGGISCNYDEVSIEEYFNQLTDSSSVKLQYIKASENILNTERNQMNKSKVNPDDENAINIEMIEQKNALKGQTNDLNKNKTEEV